MRTTLSITLLALLAVTGPALAEQTQTLKPGTVVSIDDETVVVEANGAETTYHLSEAAVVPSGVAAGDVVLVRVADAGTMTTDRVLIVDQQVMVTEDLETERAVIGSVTATGTSQLIVDTPTGEQAFVVNPEKLFPPMPAPDQRVVVTYRTENVTPPRYKATGLVVLEDDLPLTASNVEVSSEPVATVAQAEPEPAPPMEPAPAPAPEAPAPAPAPMTEEPVEALPQTGSPLPALGLLGLSLLAIGGATRFRS